MIPQRARRSGRFSLISRGLSGALWGAPEAPARRPIHEGREALRGTLKIQYFEVRKLTTAPAIEPAATPIAGHSRTIANDATHAAYVP